MILCKNFVILCLVHPNFGLDILSFLQCNARRFRRYKPYVFWKLIIWVQLYKICNFQQQQKTFQSFLDAQASQHLFDRPTQLISICWVGGGDPCGAADFCFSCLYCQKKQARSNFFSKYPCHVHNECLEIKNGEQYWVKSSKKPVCFRLLSHLASQNQEFPKWASSNQEFLKRAGSNQEFSKVNSSLPVCKNYCACVNVSSGTSLDSWILNCIREFWQL